MNDVDESQVDELLRREAQRWNAGQQLQFDLAGAMPEITAGRSRRPRVSYAAIAGRVAAVAAVLVLGIGLVLLVAHAPDDRGDRDDPVRPPVAITVHGDRIPGAITVHGERIPYAGLVPWANAVADPSNPRVLYIQANGDRIHSKEFICEIPYNRVRAIPSTRGVTIQVAGYAHPLPAGRGCVAVGHSLQRLTVKLADPLAGRTLTDPATGRRHAVLNPATVPDLKAVPVNYTPSPLTWNDTTHVATRYFTDGPTRNLPRQVTLEYAPPTSRTHFGVAAFTHSRTIAINGQPGILYTYTADISGTSFSRWVAIWTRTDRSRISLTVSGPTETILSENATLLLAMSIQ